MVQQTYVVMVPVTAFDNVVLENNTERVLGEDIQDIEYLR